MNCEQAVNHCLKRVKTNYVCFCADDDIILTEGLQTGVDFLNANTEYVGFTGQANLIGTLNDSPFCSDITIKNYNLFHSDESLVDRIKKFILNPSALIFNAVRTPAAIDAWEQIMTLNNYYQTYIFGELVHGITILSAGKIKKFDFDFCCRHGHADNAYAKLDLYKWFTLAEFNNAHQKVFSMLSDALINEEKNTTLDQVNNILRNFYFNLLQELSRKHEQLSRTTIKLKLKRILKETKIGQLLLLFKRFLLKKHLKKTLANYQKRKKSLCTYLRIVTDSTIVINRKKSN